MALLQAGLGEQFGNHDLSVCTEDAARCLRGSAASLWQLTDRVQHTSDAAVQATQNAQTNAQAAQQGGRRWGQVVTHAQDVSSLIGRIIRSANGPLQAVFRAG